ncbi:hypothetical protein QAD02_001897 [Eretmocerus hayati]|uniref:Uncharacterized protein n=1 Tax=Eretmocerus hayati TaxID=131215 RepID=A0ACC2NIL3_9HYME|nr:hypothetical protein QAD02_001897 [Eretmocerus hayati]
MAYNFPGVPAAAISAIGMGSMGPLTTISGAQNFIDLASPSFTPIPPIAIPGINDSSLEYSAGKNQPPLIRESLDDIDKRSDKSDSRRDRDLRDPREYSRRARGDRDQRDRERERERRDDRTDRDHREDRRQEDHDHGISATSNSNHSGSSSVSSSSNQIKAMMSNTPNSTSGLGPPVDPSTSVWSMGLGYPMMGMGPMGPLMGEIPLGTHLSHAHSYGAMGMGMIPHDSAIIGAPMIAPEQILNNAASQIMGGTLPSAPLQNSKEIIHCKSCSLFPPNPNAPPPTTRERPQGCRTVFVGGLPENMTESIIQEVFERCGEIATLRLSKKNFCHIRFASESSVDAAIYLSGYRVRIGSSGDSANTGRLHVDFAQARDDQYEWECRQRQLQREQRHRERVERERQRPPSSPPPIVHYTDHEASNICEKIKQDDTFMKAVQIVVTWLERGDCTKRNANTFYSMIQSTNSHVRRLLNEKTAYEEELHRAKELLKGRMQGLLIQFGQIERVFTAASHKKVWDHFTKAQRKNIEMWKKQSLEIKTIQLEETHIDGQDEMEVSDAEDEPQRKRLRNQIEDSERLLTLREENDSLRCQLEAYKNEVDLLKSETKTEVDSKDKQMKMLQQTLKSMQDQLMQSKRQLAQDNQRIRDLKFKLNAARKEDSLEDEIITLDKDDDSEDDQQASKSVVTSSGTVQISQNDAKLIGLIATFLHIHPFGASLDYVYYYLQKMEPSLRMNEVESLMQQFPQVFKQELSGIGANMERRWQFAGFNIRRSN